jgi:hypothetical protein
VTAAAGKRVCQGCSASFIGRSSAKFCGPACKQKAYRARKEPVAAAVVVPAQSGHCAESLALMAALDAELAAAGEARGLKLVWSAQEQATLELIASARDREVWLADAAARVDDLKVQLKLWGELRLTEAHRARLVKLIKTDLPPAPTLRTVKARRAANARWRRDGGGSDAESS